MTLEYLETLGVPVIGFGTNELPAFYTRQSGYQLVHRIDSAKELAIMLKTKWDLNLRGGVVIANPLPVEYAIDYAYINQAIESALVKAKLLGISGKDTTPFLLAEIKEITHGKSLDANIQLIYNNARLGASTAVELSKIFNNSNY